MGLSGNFTTASALNPTVCGSAITFLINRALSSCDQNRFSNDNAGQLVLMNLQSVARITKWCPVFLGNSSASLRMCRLKPEFFGILNELQTLSVLKS